MCEQAKRALALGYFDGLHIAHIAVLNAALEQQKNGLAPAVLLFDRHPAAVLFGKEIPQLLTPSDRDAILSGMGLELIRMRFSDIMDLSPAAFTERILVSQLNCGFISCGYNYHFGKGGSGTAGVLGSLCAAKGITLSVCPQVSFGDIPVSSSAIRRAVEAGEMAQAVSMLDRPLTFSATVISGDHRGRILGTPTINQLLPEGFITPKCGVYASFTEIGGRRYPSVTNIGDRPTFAGKTLRSETHIMDFSGDLYGQNVRVNLLSFQRSEMRFPSAEALTEQIAEDAAQAKNYVMKSAYFYK